MESCEETIKDGPWDFYIFGCSHERLIGLDEVEAIFKGGNAEIAIYVFNVSQFFLGS